MEDRKQFEQMARAMGIHWTQDELDRKYDEVQKAVEAEKKLHPDAWERAEEAAKRSQ